MLINLKRYHVLGEEEVSTKDRKVPAFFEIS